LTDPIDLSGRPQRQRRHVEQRPRAGIVRSQRQELVTDAAPRPPAAGQMLFDEMKWKCVVAGGDWSVGGEYRRDANLLEGFVERRAMLDEIADALQDEKCRMAFVQVECRWAEAE